MDERDSSTPNEDCWHSTYENFCKCDQALFPIFGQGLGTRLASSRRTYNPINDKAWSTLDWYMADTALEQSGRDVAAML